MSAPLSRPPLLRAPGALTGLYAPARPAVIIPPPLRREPAPVRVSGGVLLPPAAVDLDDDGDLPTLPSQLDHEPDDAHGGKEATRASSKGTLRHEP